MSALRPSEWEQLTRRFPGTATADGADGTSLISVPDVPLPAGWSARTGTVWFLVPVGYPAAQPDCFWSDHGLRLAAGGMPTNSAAQSLPVLGGPALWFSWHLTAWRPSHDNVSTFTRFVLRRFDDAR